MRRTIVKYFLIFLVLHAALYIGFIVFLNTKSVSGKNRKAMNTPRSCRYLLLGNSHTLRALDTAQLANTLQLAEFGDSPEAIYYKLKKIVHDKKIKFDYVIIPFDFTTVCPFTVNLKNYKSPFYYNAIDVNEYEPDKVMMYKKWKEKLLYRLFAYKEFAMELEKLRESRRKFRKSYTFISEKRSATEAAENFLIKNLGCNESPTAENSLQFSFQYKIIDLCLQKDIRLIAVASPLHKSLNAAMKKYKNNYFVKSQEELFIFLRKKGIPFLDYRNFLEPSGNQIFSDYQHLNVVGQHFFTPHFIHDIDSLGVIKKEK